MQMLKPHLATLAALTWVASVVLCGQPAQAAEKPAVKIGVLTDMAGNYASMGGAGSVAAAKLAIDACLAA